MLARDLQIDLINLNMGERVGLKSANFSGFSGDDDFLNMRLRLFDVVWDHTGSALVEFTIVLPVLLFLVFGIAQFGLIFYNYIMVANATTVGSRQFATSRLDSSGATHTIAAINNATTNLTNLSISLSVNNQAACSTSSSINDKTCQNQLQAAWNTFVAGCSTSGSTCPPPEPAIVTVSYSNTGACTLMPTYLINITSLCPMTWTMQQAVE